MRLQSQRLLSWRLRMQFSQHQARTLMYKRVGNECKTMNEENV